MRTNEIPVVYGPMPQQQDVITVSEEAPELQAADDLQAQKKPATRPAPLAAACCGMA